MPSTYSLKKDLLPLLKIAVPLALTGTAQSGVFFFETLFLAHLGEKTLAAGALVSWLYGTIAVILFGTLSAINILVALKYGAKDEEGIASVARDGFWLAVLISIPAILLFWNMSPIFLLFGQSESVVLLAEAYLRALAWGLLPNFLMMAILEVIIGMGHTRIVIIFTFISVAINIFSSYLLIFGKWGLPAFGIAGAGWGNTISYCVSLVLLALYLVFDKKYWPQFRKIVTFVKPYFTYELLQVGLPVGVMYCFEVGFFLALTLMMGFIGSKALAANQVVMQYLCFFMSTMFSIAQAITVRIGHLLGAHDHQAAKRVNSLGMTLATIFMGLIAILYWFFPNVLIMVDFKIHDPNNADLIKYIKELFFISAFFQIFEAVRVALFGSLRGLKDTNFTLLISIFSFWGFAFPVGYMFAFPLAWGGAGFWYAMTLGAVISVILLYFRFQKKMAHH